MQTDLTVALVLPFLTGVIAGLRAMMAPAVVRRAARARLAAAFGQDRPATLIEDAVAIGGALLIVLAVS